MSTKRGKLTAGKARERVASLEESIAARQHRLDQLVARLERTEAPDERLLTAKSRLERRLDLERDQLEKLNKLLQRDTGRPEESVEDFGSEEIDDLHRSFEEVRQNVAHMQARFDSSELPRDLTNRLSSFEERVSRREEVDTELFGQVLALQTSLEQERQALRRLSRRTREQDQSLDALREAVEDSVLATVDLAERLDELEESLSEHAETKSASAGDATFSPPAPGSEIEELKDLVEDTRRGLLTLQSLVQEAFQQAEQDSEDLRREQADQGEQLATLAARAQSLAPAAPLSPPLPAPAASPPGVTADQLQALLDRIEALEKAVAQPDRAAPSADRAAPATPSEGRERPWTNARPATFAPNGQAERKPAVFATRSDSARPATLSANPNPGASFRSL